MSVARDAVTAAAFRLFNERGYEETSVEDIAKAAGVSRSTFFRLYGAKEAVIFPEHEELLERVQERLTSGVGGDVLTTVTEAVKVVLFHYVSEGERARERYRLTSAVPVLREREITSGLRYQRLFRRFLSQSGDGSTEAELRSEVVAAAVVAAHNRVLRRWLRGEAVDPRREVEQAMDLVKGAFAGEPARKLGVIVVSNDVSLDEVEAAVRSSFAGR